MTPAEAQRHHDARRAAEPEHDDGGSCWCCCMDGCANLADVADDTDDHQVARPQPLQIRSPP